MQIFTTPHKRSRSAAATPPAAAARTIAEMSTRFESIRRVCPQVIAAALQQAGGDGERAVASRSRAALRFTATPGSCNNPATRLRSRSMPDAALQTSQIVVRVCLVLVGAIALSGGAL